MLDHPHVLTESIYQHLRMIYGIDIKGPVSQCPMDGFNTADCLGDFKYNGQEKMISIYNSNIKPMRGLFLTVDK